MDKAESIIDVNHLENMRLYTMDEILQILGGVSRSTMNTYFRTGKIKGVKVGRSWRATGENLRNFLEGKT